ncbi:MAG: phosphatase PAP2 family protein [Ruminococcaceae bacterium]|nr:phosphatase PAP2 family protein [Oscillospiraceae bacterium]
MEFLYFLESIRNPVLTAIMSVITYLGDEVAFLALALGIFWCVNKKRGYYLLSVGFCGVIINQVLKLCFRVPRPWVIDPEFSAVESAVPAATGYSFPSGHTQNVTCTFGGVARFSKALWIRIASIAVIVLVAFSRMYLGVHTPLDVCVSLVIGVGLVFALYPLFEYANKRENVYYWIFGSFFIISLGFLAFALIFPQFVPLDAAHSASALKNACTILGATAGMLIAYPVDRYFVKFEEKASVLGQILKLAVGLAVVLLIKSGLKEVFTLGGVEEHFMLRALRYFLIVVFAGCIYPMTFKLFAKIGTKK